MNRNEADRIAVLGAQIYAEYGRQLLTIVRASRQKHGLPEGGPIGALCNDVQDGSFRLGLLAGLRVQGDPALRTFLEEKVALLDLPEPSAGTEYITISAKALRDSFGIPEEWRILSAHWLAAEDILRLRVTIPGALGGPRDVEISVVATEVLDLVLV
jgi:hypothetical protein